MDYSIVKVKTHSSAWHELRRCGIGGSDAACVLGISPWRTPLDVWMEKTGRLEPNDLSDNERVEWGLLLEGVIAKKYKARHEGYSVRAPGGTFVSTRYPFMFVNPDRIVTDDDWRAGGLEIKTASSERDWFAEDGGETIPDYYYTQALQYLAVADGLQFVDFAVLVSGHKYFERHLERAGALDDIAFLIEREREFWQDYVLTDTAPAAQGGTDNQSLIELYPQGGSALATIDSQSVIDAIPVYLKASETVKKAEEAKDRAALVIKQFLGEAGADWAQNDEYKISWRRSEITKFDKGRLKEDHPELIALYEYKAPRDGGISIKRLQER